MKTKNNASVGFNVASDIEKNAYDMGSEQNMQSVRLGFIRKVFVILTLQLILTFGIILILNVVEPINTFCKNEGGWLFWVTFIISFAILIAISCSPNLARNHPTNLVALSAFTLFEGLFLGVVCAFYQLDEILLATAITLGVSASLILFASQTKIDFTSKGLYLYASLWVLILLGLFTPFYMGTGNLIYSGLGALIFSLVSFLSFCRINLSIVPVSF
jgi:protein lifeguard